MKLVEDRTKLRYNIETSLLSLNDELIHVFGASARS